MRKSILVIKIFSPTDFELPSKENIRDYSLSLHYMFPGICTLSAKTAEYHLSKDYSSYEKKTVFVFGFLFLLFVFGSSISPLEINV